MLLSQHFIPNKLPTNDSSITLSPNPSFAIFCPLKMKRTKFRTTATNRQLEGKNRFYRLSKQEKRQAKTACLKSFFNILLAKSGPTIHHFQ